MFLGILWGDCIRDEPNRADDKVPFDPEEPYRRGTWLRDASSYFAKTAPKATLEELLVRHPEYNIRSLSSPPSSVQTNVPGHPIQCAARIFAFSSAKLQEAKQTLRDSVPAEFLTVNNIIERCLWLSITRIQLRRYAHDGLRCCGRISPARSLALPINARSEAKAAMSNKSCIEQRNDAQGGPEFLPPS